MEQFTEVIKHLKSAYIAAAGNPDIGPADGRIARIGAIIVELSSPQVLFEAQRESQQIRENTLQTPQKKSPLTPMERKPSASLMNAKENPVLQNMSGKPGVAGNPDKPFSNAKEVKLPENPKWAGESGGIDKLTFKEVTLTSVTADDGKHREAMQLTETPGEIAMLENEHAELIRHLTPNDYSGKTPKYVAEKFSLEQIEATLKELGIVSAPGRSVKGKAADLINSGK